MSDFKKIQEINLSTAREIRKNLDAFIEDVENMKEGDNNIDSLLIEGSFWTNAYFICSNAYQKFCKVWGTEKDDKTKTAATMNTELILDQAVLLHEKGMKDFYKDNVPTEPEGN